MKNSEVLCIVLFAFLLICSHSVLADEGGVNISRTQDGQNVTISVDLAPGSNIQATDATISYKNENLSFVDMSNGNAANTDGSILMTNHDAENSIIYLSYASINAYPDGGNLLTIHFTENKPSTEPEIGVGFDQVYNADAAPLPLTVSGDGTMATTGYTESINTPEVAAKAVALNNPQNSQNAQNSQTTNTDPTSSVNSQSTEPTTPVSNPNDSKSGKTDGQNEGVLKTMENNKLGTAGIVGIIILLIVVASIIIYRARKNKEEDEEEIEHKKNKKSEEDKVIDSEKK